MIPPGYDAVNIEKIARALYTASRGEGASTWGVMVRHAEQDGTAAQLVEHWHAVAIASLDLTYGMRARMASA